MLIDKHGRTIDYVRIAVTDKCNLRCFYCMPEKGISFIKKENLLSYEEIVRIMHILAQQGVNKIRITGGEPFLRKEVTGLLKTLSQIKGVDKIAITTNGTLTAPYLDELIDMGIESFNLSLDSLDSVRFHKITRRDYFDDIMNCYQEMLDRKLQLKLNCVVMKDQNIEDIIPMVNLGKQDNISVRFIEEMPFNGAGNNYTNLEWNHNKILNHIKEHHREIIKLKDPQGSTSYNYKVANYAGSFGIIPAYTRSFCGSCNRLRITPDGTIKTCLYDDGVFNIRDIIRAGATDAQLLATLKEAVGHKAKDGFEAEKNRLLNPIVSESMATIGG